MKKGYRLNSAHAYANYYADISNVAEFNFFGQGANAILGAGANAIHQGRRAAAAINNQALQLGKRFYKPNKEQFRALVQKGLTPSEVAARTTRIRRGIGYGIGAGGAGAVLGTGYLGYRALRPGRQEEEEM